MILFRFFKCQIKHNRNVLLSRKEVKNVDKVVSKALESASK